MPDLPGVVIIEGHIQGLANARMLGSKGIPIIVIDKGNCLARYSRFCSKYFRCPDYLSEGFIGFLERLAIAEGLKNWLLLPSNDHAVYNIASHREKLQKYYQIITEELCVIEKIYNKKSLLELAQNIKIPIPYTVLPGMQGFTLSKIKYPALIKGNNGLNFYRKFQRKAFLVESEPDLIRIVKLIEAKSIEQEYFIQELIPPGTNTISSTVFCVKGIVYAYWMGEKLREHPIRFGTATCCRSMFEPSILDQTRLLVKELGYTGVCEVEWLLDTRDNKYKLIEINARTWLWVGLAGKCGINYPVMIYDYIHKGMIPVQSEYELGRNWINLYTDLFYSVSRLLHRLDKAKNIIATYRKFSEASWKLDDPIPFFAYGFLLLDFLRHR